MGNFPTNPEPESTPRDAELNEPAMHGLAHGPGAAMQTRQPRGLATLFMTEMWERFSFYGMKALLVLYLVKIISVAGLGPGIHSNTIEFEDQTHNQTQSFPQYVAIGGAPAPQPSDKVIPGAALQVTPPPDRVVTRNEAAQIKGRATWTNTLSVFKVRNTSSEPVNYSVRVAKEGENPQTLFTVNTANAPSTGKIEPGESKEFAVEVNTEQSGLNWEKPRAGSILAWYTGLVYLMPIFGGFLADRFLGTHRCLVIGAIVIAAGHFTLMGDTVQTLYAGLLLVIIGTGFFKSNVSTMVGQMYSHGDARRDAGFTIFYMGINLGAFLAPLVCGWLRVRYGWSWGFGAAGVGMTFGLIQYLIGRPKHLKGIGDPPSREFSLPQFLATIGAGAVLLAFVSALSFPDSVPPVRVLFDAISHSRALQLGVPLVIGAAVVSAIGIFVSKQEPQDRGPVATIFILAFFVIFFWTAFEQAAGSMAFFGEEKTNRALPGALAFLVGGKPATGDAEFPAEWFQSVNPLMILLLAPLFASLWVRLAARGREPSTPVKMSIGLISLGLGFVLMVAASELNMGGAKVSPFWLVGAFFVHTCAELCLSPVGLSMVTKLSPVKVASLMMGTWFLANFVANFLAATLAGQVDKISETGFILKGHAGFFLIFVIAPCAAGALLFVISPLLKKMMHGRG